VHDKYLDDKMLRESYWGSHARIRNAVGRRPAGRKLSSRDEGKKTNQRGRMKKENFIRGGRPGGAGLGLGAGYRPSTLLKGNREKYISNRDAIDRKGRVTQLSLEEYLNGPITGGKEENPTVPVAGKGGLQACVPI